MEFAISPAACPAAISDLEIVPEVSNVSSLDPDSIFPISKSASNADWELNAAVSSARASSFKLSFNTFIGF